MVVSLLLLFSLTDVFNWEGSDEQSPFRPCIVGRADTVRAFQATIGATGPLFCSELG